MNHGVFNMTQKRNARACIGECRIFLSWKKAHAPCSQLKTILVCFFDYKMIVHDKFVLQRQTMNQQCYLEVLTRLWESVRRRKPDKWILHHENAPEHDVLRSSWVPAIEIRYKKWIIHLIHLKTHSYFRLFPKIKKCPKETKICLHSWHRMQLDNITVRCSRK
jgi:hypothetical protein